jgi:hypothetical protein
MRTGQGVMQRLGRMAVLGLALISSGCGGEGGSSAVPPMSGPAPTAEAGRDQTVVTGTPVTLDGSRSVSRTTGLITYRWTLTSKPAGSVATLSGAGSVRPTFTADVAGAYTAQLVVDTGGLSSNPDTVTITCGTGNLPPIANAGPDRTVRPGTLVTLHGADSYDPNGTPVAYAWTLLSQPPNSRAVLAHPSSAAPTFTPTEVGRYGIALTVSDGNVTSPPDEIEITVATGNVPPIADAGPDQQVSIGHVIMLTGGHSTDPNGDPLTYSWRFQCLPAGSTATLADAGTGHPNFTADVAGQYVVSLVVSDGALSSPLDTVVIEARLAGVQGFNGPVRQVVGAADGSGDIYVRGNFTSYRGRTVAQVVRLGPDGRLHPFTLPAVIGLVVSIAIADDGSGDLYVADSRGDGMEDTGPILPFTAHIWRLNRDGLINPTFTVGTAVTDLTDSDNLPFPLGPVIDTLTPVGDHSGRLYGAVTGTRLYNGTAVGKVARLNADGTVDPSFRSSGVAGAVVDIIPAQDGTGRLYVANIVRVDPSSTGHHAVTRLTPDGTPDPTFRLQTLSFPAGWIGPIVPVLDGTGDLFIAGVFPEFAIALGRVPVEPLFLRLNQDRSVDDTSPIPQIPPLTYVEGLAKAGDGSGDWLLAQLTAQNQHTVLRYRADGAIDPTFTPGELSGAINARIFVTIVPAPDKSGDFYVAGEFSSYNGVAASHLVRINSNGTLDERSR